MKLVLKKYLEVVNFIDNNFAFNYFKNNLEYEMSKIEVLTSILNEDLSDEEYKDKILSIYDIVFNDFSNVKENNIIYTDIPLYSEENEKPIWNLRAYEVANNNISFIGTQNEESLKKLVDDGVILIDMIPYKRVRYEYTFIQRNNIANKIPVLSNMDEDNELYDEYLITALRNYPKDLIEKDRVNLLKNINKKLEHIKMWTQKSTELTKEKLDVEAKVIDYCENKLEELENKGKNK